MRFFGRKKEISILQEIRQKSSEVAQFTVITGRRRIGKTSLVLKAYDNIPILYFFVARKSELELCEDYRNEITERLGTATLGRATKFADVFEYVMRLSETQQITLFIDEFQEFLRVNKSVYSEMQRIWDLHKDRSHINLLVCGSINSLMNKIFRDGKEPLYGRQTQMLTIKPFVPSTIKEILSEYNPSYTSEDLLALYSLTGGVAKYIEALMDNRATTKRSMIDYVTSANSLFIDDGKAILIEEFGKDYGIYFSILSAISQGRTTRQEIEDVIGKEIGGYLAKLENDYGIINKRAPIYEKSNKNIHYTMDDNFFIFWFRFIHKYNYMIEISAYDKLNAVINRDYNTFSGMALERYFRAALIESQKYTRIGNWWDRKGENEIDIIAEDELSYVLDIYEVKRNSNHIDMSILRSKAENFLNVVGTLKKYKISYHGLSMDDM